MAARKTMARLVMAGVLLLGGATFALAQQGQPGQGGGAGGAGGFNPQRFMDRIKQDLGLTDDEWRVFQPKLEKVQTLARDASGMGGGMMGGGRGGRGGRGNNNPATPPAGTTTQPQVSEAAKALQELRTTLDNKDATAADITAKLTAYREAREKAKKELADARAALKEICTAKQEAQLVTMSILD